ncbi:MAG: choice-of-anchor E domain-containing protein [Tropicimonas sp.]|uniref:choice-of-anchor E domain-containing protein n=1 Tax=Tropicimonas sp. TaxID=2067044 RepID=UPI003A886961
MKLIPLCALALIATVPAASAATLSTSDTVTRLQQTSDDVYDGTFTFDQFDTSLGTLTSATLNFSYFFLSEVQVFDLSDDDGSATVESRMTVEFMGGSGKPLASNLLHQTVEDETVDDEGEIVLVGQGQSLSLPLGDLAALTGSGTFSLGYRLSTGTQVTGANSTFETTAGLQATIEYVYEQVTLVPITPALPLLGSALLLLVPFRRRRV